MSSVEVPIEFVRTTLGMLFPPRLMRDDIQAWLEANARSGWRLEGPRPHAAEYRVSAWVLVFESADEAQAFVTVWL